MFLNGDLVRLFVALASALFGVLWRFLSILGIAQSFLKNVVAALAVLSFVVWRIFDAHLRKYEQGSWRSGKAPPRREKTEIRVAIILWLFVLIFFGTAIFVPWWRDHLR